MNMIANKSFTDAQDASDLEETKNTNPSLAKLMKAWESKQASIARKVGGVGMVAVSLAACGSSSTNDDDGDDEGTGSIFMLTIDADPTTAQIDFDNITGTDGDDIFNAPLGLLDASGIVGLALAPTLQGGDIIDGGDGVDTLNAVLNGNFGAISGDAPTITNVEIINFEMRESPAIPGFFGSYTEVDFSNVSGAEQVWLVDTTDVVGLGIYNVQAPIIVGLRNVDDVDDYWVEYAADVWGSDDVEQVVVLDDATDANLWIGVQGDDEISTLTIQSLGDSSGINFGGDLPGVETLNVSGDGGSLDLGNQFNDLITLAAGGYDGDLTINLIGAGDIETIMTGSGDDNVSVSSAALDGVVVIDLGAGEDTLGVDKDGVGDFDTSDIEDLDFSTVSGVEILSLLDDVELDADLTWDLSDLPELTTLEFTDFGNDGFGPYDIRLEGVSDLDIISAGDFIAGTSSAKFSGTFRDLSITAENDVDIYFYDLEDIVGEDHSVSNLRDFTVTTANGDVDVEFYNDDENGAYAGLRTVSITALDEDDDGFGGDVDLEFDNDDGADYASSLQTIAVIADGYADVDIDNDDAPNFMSALQSITVEANGNVDVSISNSDGANYMSSLQTIDLISNEGRVDLNIDSADGGNFMASLQSITIDAATYAELSFSGGDAFNFASNLQTVVITAGADVDVSLDAGNDGSFNAFGSLTSINIVANTDEDEAILRAGNTTELDLDGDQLATQSFTSLTSISVQSSGYAFMSAGGTFTDNNVGDVDVDLEDMFGSSLDVVISTSGAGEITFYADDTPGLESVTIVGDYYASIGLSDDQENFNLLDLTNFGGAFEVDNSVNNGDFGMGFGLAEVDTTGFGNTEFGSDISILIGVSDLDYVTDVDNGVTETFTFVGSDIGQIEITGFDTTAAASGGDMLDFSAYGITSGQLTFTQDGSDLVITSTEFSGEITLFAEAGETITEGDLMGNIQYV